MATVCIDGCLLTRHWRDTPDGVELEFWLASDSGPLKAVISGERSVFFLARCHRQQADQLIAGERDVELCEVALRDFSDRPVDAFYCHSYRQSRRIARKLIAAGLDPLEADINPADRYLMERFILGSATVRGEPHRRSRYLLLENPVFKPSQYSPQLKLVSFDIETAMQGLQLFSIAVQGVAAGAETRRVFMLGRGATGDQVSCYPSQQALLEAFLDWLADYDPDVLIGWNVVNFDTWYLQRVADVVGSKLSMGRERRPAYWRVRDDGGDRRIVQLPGRVVLDGIELLRAAFYRFESFSLENVSRELLGEGKLLHGGGRGEQIARLFTDDKDRLADYNLKDCELVSAIFTRAALLPFALARAGLTGLNIDRMGGSVASFDNLYLPRLHRAGYVAPNASGDHSASPGGFVLDSMPGIYDHVLVLDFKSLYPSIIRTFCIDPLGLARGENLPEADTVDGYLAARFAREGHILPALITRLWQRRDVARQSSDAALSQAIKIIMNSFYGVLGTPGCRFFDARLASSITLRGQQILTRTRDYIERAGHRVIYGDTDSVFVWIEDATDDAQAEAAGHALVRDLNAWWARVVADEFGLDSALELEFETHFRRFLMPTVRGSDKGSKKRYAGVVAHADGERLIFKGLENVRSDWTRLARRFQQELYRRVFAQEPFESYMKELVAKVLAGQCNEDLVYRKRLRRGLDEYERNVPPHVQAARLGAARGQTPCRRGDWIEYVITVAGAEPVGWVIAPLDYQHYVDKQLEPIADGILGFAGTSFRAVIDRQIDLFQDSSE